VGVIHKVFHKGRLRLHYTEAGSGPPVVLVHGLSGSRLWWRKNLPALSQEFRVYTVDLVGFGGSRRQRVLPLVESAALLSDWMKSLELGEPRLVGHSMGAHIALHVVTLKQARIAALVLVAASALVRGAWWKLATRLPRAGLNGALDFLPTLAFDALRAGPRNLLRATQEILRDDPGAHLAEVRVPTLLVWGERDVIVPRDLGEQLQRSIPGSRLVVIPGAGHNVMYDRPQDFNRTVIPFLRDPGGAEAPLNAER
jgi:pimeloyl-ACP methyl ester carboxylesterase